MGFGYRAFLASGLGFAAAFVVACGSSGDLLSADQSSTISQQLSAISSAVSAGQCARAQSAVGSLNSSIAALPSSVSQKLVQNLGQGASTVKELAARDCETAATSTTTTSTTTST